MSFGFCVRCDEFTHFPEQHKIFRHWKGHINAIHEPISKEEDEEFIVRKVYTVIYPENKDFYESTLCSYVLGRRTDQGQWWSIFKLQVLQTEQWWARSGLMCWHFSQNRTQLLTVLIKKAIQISSSFSPFIISSYQFRIGRSAAKCLRYRVCSSALLIFISCSISDREILKAGGTDEVFVKIVL